MANKSKQANLLENLYIVILALYPLRHINWGIDLWDTGYSYSNFQYMGMEHVDPMWLFSTFLSNAFGNLLTRLPRAGSLVGMNFYTGLLVSLLALGGYFFCTRKLKMPGWIAFLGEFTAVSLCWCPTAVLYNYLTYVLFGACALLLYQGLTGEKPLCLVFAGACLGANVLVRFSNLPEAAMILTVWAYDILTARQTEKPSQNPQEGLWRRLGQHTFWCFAGYGSSLLALLGYIHVRYGFGNYVAGIRRLFAMTDNAADYQSSSLLLGAFQDYVENLYWALRIGIILAAGLALFAAMHWLAPRLPGAKGSDAASGRAVRILRQGTRLLWVAVCAAMPVWLYLRGTFSMDFLHDGPISYGPMQRTGIFFLMLTLLIGLIRFFHRDSPPEEKLLDAIVVLMVLLTPIGSNNKLMPALNNLFLAAPYTLWQSWRFCRNVSEKHIWKLTLDPFPAKGLLLSFLLMCLFLFGGFGFRFSFAEATGVYNLTASVDNNVILQNIKMCPEKAKWLTELSECVAERGLRGREVIPYGWIPSLCYYLQMPPAFNPWSDLDSYSYEVMANALSEVEREMQEPGGERPVVLVNYLHSGLEEDRKWQLIVDFMNRNGYQPVWQNDKFILYECVEKKLPG